MLWFFGGCQIGVGDGCPFSFRRARPSLSYLHWRFLGPSMSELRRENRRGAAPTPRNLDPGPCIPDPNLACQITPPPLSACPRCLPRNLGSLGHWPGPASAPIRFRSSEYQPTFNLIPSTSASRVWPRCMESDNLPVGFMSWVEPESSHAGHTEGNLSHKGVGRQAGIQHLSHHPLDAIDD